MNLHENIIELQEVDSTNRYASELLVSANPHDGTVVRADYQRDGRGQQNTGWFSDAGKNLTFSIIFFPWFLKIEEQFYLSKVVSLGIMDYLKHLGGGFSIKWPNDILHEKEKLAGILIECGIEGDKIKHAIVGIGLNANQLEFDKSIPNPISLKKILDKEIDLDNLLKSILEAINKRYNGLEAGDFEGISADYLSHLKGYRQTMKFRKKGLPFTAKITGVSPTGEIILKENNHQQLYGFKEVEFLL
jgi:BirA family biotin operon repressor/biotin-[acetyl-CoA-carboxylase] ligase